MKLRIIDLFSGIGGFSLGLEATGHFETVRFCEMKPHARAVLKKNFGPVPCDNDVTKMEFQEGEADVITAGFPCQDISFAGEGAGLSGARSGLYREVIRSIRMVRPKWAVLENVAALLNRGLDTVLGDLATVGYDAEWHCIPASAVGAPHRRDRIWIIANPGGEQHEGSCSPLSGSLASQLSGATADSNQQRTQVPETGEFSAIEIAGGSCCKEHLADAAGEWINGSGERPEPTRWTELTDGCWWSSEPDVGRVAHGVSSRVDRLAELGNAVVPQIPEMIGHAILEAERSAA